jgi:NADPH-dependent 2,4-dienoyl-CoA reductase/sulfur reductase-like enzyme
VAPSAIAYSNPGSVVPREMTVEEILETEDDFARAALRAKQAGFDVVWLHGAHLYLINAFLSPDSNRRQDDYGGSFNKRLRFLLEIIQKTRQKIGPDFPLMVSLNAVEAVEGGLTIEQTRQIAQRLEAAGVNAIRLSHGNLPPAAMEGLDYFGMVSASNARFPQGYLVPLAAAVKAVVSIPVMVAGRILTPELAEKILQQEKADIIGIARGLIADSQWPNKARTGRQREIRHCIGCGWCSPGPRIRHCSVNPRWCQEAENKITPAARVKTVLIAGGGPAGLEAARVAALRGHQVTLYEKDKLGGQINLACVPPAKEDIKLFLDYEKVQMEILKVNIKSEELTADKVRQAKPDAVVVATGAQPVWPDFPGSHNRNVVTVWQVLDGSVVPQGKVVVLGGGQYGAETAEYLASRGCQVTIIEASEIAKGSQSQLSEGADYKTVLELVYLRQSLRFLGVNILKKAILEGVTEGGVTVNRSGECSTIEADTIVLALGHRSNAALADQLKDLGLELYVVGDCSGVGKLAKAVKEGFKAGLAL